jgi:hypothetical protein
LESRGTPDFNRFPSEITRTATLYKRNASFLFPECRFLPARGSVVPIGGASSAAAAPGSPPAVAPGSPPWRARVAVKLRLQSSAQGCNQAAATRYVILSSALILLFFPVKNGTIDRFVAQYMIKFDTSMGEKAIWDAANVKLFCDLCTKEVNAGHMPLGHLNKSGLEEC